MKERFRRKKYIKLTTVVIYIKLVIMKSNVKFIYLLSFKNVDLNKKLSLLRHKFMFISLLKDIFLYKLLYIVFCIMSYFF